MNDRLKFGLGAIAIVGSFSLVFGNGEIARAGCPRAEMGAVNEFAQCGKLLAIGGANPSAGRQFELRAARQISVAVADYQTIYLARYDRPNRDGQLITVRYETTDRNIAAAPTSKQCPNGTAKALGCAISIELPHQQISASR